MMKPPKAKVQEENTDPAPLTEAEMISMNDFYSFYKNRDLAEIMIAHDFLPPTPKEHQGDRQWQIDEMALRLEYCKATRINIVFANKLNKIQNSYSPPADVHSMYFSQKHPYAEFELLESDNTVCKLQCHLKPNHKWIPVTFDLIDAQDQRLVKENSAHWKGNGVQNMLAKNCRIKAENILDRSFVGNAPVEYNQEENTSTQQIEEEVKTQIVSFSKPEESKSFTPNILQEEPKPIQPVFDIIEEDDIVPTPVNLPEITPQELEDTREPKPEPINTSPITPAEIQQIRDQKISELPPTADAPLEILEDLNPMEQGFKEEAELAKLEAQQFLEDASVVEKEEEPKKKKSGKKSKDPKPDTAFMDKEPKKELRKPFGMSQLTIPDPKYHTQEIYDLIGDDWFGSFQKKDLNILLWTDLNVTMYQNLVKQWDEKKAKEIEANYQNFVNEANDTEKLIVLYHDALTSVENPPPLNIFDTKYLEQMLFVVNILKTFKSTKTDKEEIRQEFFEWFTKQNKGESKEAKWAYQFMVSRKMI